MPKNNGKNIWKSIKEYENDPEILKAKLEEFKEKVIKEEKTRNLFLGDNFSWER